MSGYVTRKTSPEVWAVLHARHGADLKVFASYSAPDGDMYGDHTKSRMETSYGFINADVPLMEAKTTWDFQPSKPTERKNEKHEYWLCVPTKEPTE